MFLNYMAFARKIVAPHELFVFNFWKEIIGVGASLLGGVSAGGWGSAIGAGASLLASKSASDDASDAADRQGAATDKQSRIAQEQWDMYKQTYAPLEKEFVDKSRQGITPDIDGVTGRASADVVQSFDKTRESTNRTMGRYGINPNSGRFTSSNRDLDIAQAGNEAGAVNRARTNEINRADDVGYSRIQSAVNAGKGIPSSVNSQLGNVSRQRGNQSDNYGQSASSTANFVSGLPWNDLFSGGGSKNSIKPAPAAPSTSGGGGWGITPNSIGGVTP